MNGCPGPEGEASWNAELLEGKAPDRVRAWCSSLGERAGVPADAIWDWAFVERVSAGLFMLKLGDPDRRAFLSVADLLADH